MMSSRSLIKFMLPLLVLALGISGFSYLKASRPEKPQPEPKEKVWQVSVLEAQPQAIAPSLTLYGETESPTLLRAAAPGAGLVTEVLVRKGESVRQGQRLLALDPRDFEFAIEQARADVLDLEAQLTDLALRHRADLASLEEEKQLLELARAELAREERLRKQSLSSESALDDARNALGRQELAVISRRSEVNRHAANRSQLEARLQRNQARLAEAELALERSQVIAPFDGVVAEVAVSIGDRVQTANILLSLYSLADLELRARIPAQYQAEIQNALAEGQILKAHAKMGARAVQLVLDRLAGEADPSGINGLFRVVEGANSLRLGNLLKLNLQRPAQQGLVPIPFQAIYGNNRIYLLKEGRMQGLNVETVGQFFPEHGQPSLLIRSPELQAGDRIIQTHLPNAVTGLKVKVVDS